MYATRHFEAKTESCKVSSLSSMVCMFSNAGLKIDKFNQDM